MYKVLPAVCKYFPLHTFIFLIFCFTREGSVIIELVMIVDNQKDPDAVSKVANQLPQLRQAHFTIHEQQFWLTNLTINNVTSKIVFLSLQTNYLLIVKNLLTFTK